MAKAKKDKRRRNIILVTISLVLVSIILSFLVIALIDSKPLCGNGRCDIIENWKTCPSDCEIPIGELAVCGDGVCEYPEDEIHCPVDCGMQTTECGDGVCEMPETRIDCPEDCEIGAWLVDYRKEMIAAGIPDNYRYATKDFDYRTRNIQELIYDIKSNSISAEGAVKRTAREVYNKVEYLYVDNPIYDPLGAGHDCQTIPASEILARGYGLCSTQSKVNIAILRGIGIAARPISGCGALVGFCKPLAILPGDPLPKFGDIDEGGITGGGLHAWLEAWLPGKGWVIVESTNGMVYEDPICAKYNILNTNPEMFNFCKIWKIGYKEQCEEGLF